MSIYDFGKKQISGGIYALNSSKKSLSIANNSLVHHPYLLYGINLWVVLIRNTHTCWM